MNNPEYARCVYLKPSFPEDGAGSVIAACSSPTRRGDSSPWCVDVTLNEKNCPVAVGEPRMGTVEYAEWRQQVNLLFVRSRRKAVIHPDYRDSQSGQEGLNF